MGKERNDAFVARAVPVGVNQGMERRHVGQGLETKEGSEQDCRETSSRSRV